MGSIHMQLTAVSSRVQLPGNSNRQCELHLRIILSKDGESTPPPNPTPWGPVAEASPGTHAVTFSKSRWVRRRGWTGPCFRGWPGRARSTLQRALVGLGRRT